MKKLKKVFTKNEDVQALQDNVAHYLVQLDSLPELDSHFIQDIRLTSAVDNIVPHELNRRIQGWYVVRQNANAVVYESSTVNDNPTAYVILRASATCTVSIIFF